MKKLFAPLMLLVTGSMLQAQAQELKLPQPSSTQTVTQDFGLGKINLTYSRPNVHGRKIFGGLLPYGEVWRTGANTATVINFTDAVTIDGHQIPAGEYALFTIPNPKEWTIILNKSTKQWGAYSYKEGDDVLRFKVKPAHLNSLLETFTMQFANVEPSTADLHLMWERTDVILHLTTDVDTRAMANIDAAMQGEKKPYYAAAMYYYNTNKDLNKALGWITEAEKTNPKSPVYKVWKARIQLKMGNKAAAITTAQEGAQLAKEAKNEEYARLNEAVIAQAK
ncbi:DUF2911 domain-containing protein [Mucilaginibacter robiniae]|uniref:DUF2911 domain-containing protein n=1 Tax=Mucilaginibacter robiniae TaxID=2728022 RepID=A0A7L5E265_9SPHI|nr:DUF2911 domain-containing protein [Mucilaginibacter robiniae]QJD94903.1 DUF2911 domain-containing protein [Mucilaginibacter robiniae]